MSIALSAPSRVTFTTTQRLPFKRAMSGFSLKPSSIFEISPKVSLVPSGCVITTTRA